MMVADVRARVGYDDSVAGFGVHGAGGTLGAILTGVFASRAINPIFKDAHGNILPSGAMEGNIHQMTNQLIGVAIAWALAAAGTVGILKVVDPLVGLRGSKIPELPGPD